MITLCLHTATECEYNMSSLGLQHHQIEDSIHTLSYFSLYLDVQETSYNSLAS